MKNRARKGLLRYRMDRCRLLGSSEPLVDPDTGNRVSDTVMLDSSSHFVTARSGGRGLGVSDLLVVDTAARSSRRIEPRTSRARCADAGTRPYLQDGVRPGTYTLLEEGPRFKIKRIVVKPGGCLSLQMHHHRSEHWVVVKGTAKVTNNDRETFVYTDQSTYIPAGNKHRLENPGKVELVLIEVQSGEYVGEDDIVRFEDKYGRA
jgi:mannose-1-phosphate guanylyltransferase